MYDFLVDTRSYRVKDSQIFKLNHVCIMFDVKLLALIYSSLLVFPYIFHTFLSSSRQSLVIVIPTSGLISQSSPQVLVKIRTDFLNSQIFWSNQVRTTQAVTLKPNATQAWNLDQTLSIIIEIWKRPKSLTKTSWPLFPVFTSFRAL